MREAEAANTCTVNGANPTCHSGTPIPEMRTSPLIRTPCTVMLVYQTTPEMKTPPLIRTL